MTTKIQLAIEAGKRDAATFADEFLGEVIDPAQTDWDSAAWGMEELSRDEDADQLWPAYQAALIDGTRALARKTTKEPVTTSGWYEHTDGTVGHYIWSSGVLSRRQTVASWLDVPERDYADEDRDGR